MLATNDTFAATSLTTLIAMVAAGLGITLLPNLAVAAGVTGNIQVQLTPLPDACPRRVVLAWRPVLQGWMSSAPSAILYGQQEMTLR